MKLKELLEKITPLPWDDKYHPWISHTSANPEAIATTSYAYHAANVLPELVRTLEYVQQCCAPHDESFLGEFSNEVAAALAKANEVPGISTAVSGVQQ